ncbi:unnamed protein product [Cuscuta campestris]|uniref:Uncharacterized protein n=2 Tax=Cuscuta sect. Cleistogrammica TaxID=1824901 RepID=A0A484K7Z6_9ASTE|nr:hypothetical protein DM860_003593 [Cuscuta australis]VFQ58929.1 unnamed protein product [Cuscuta campestris]
MARTPCCDKDGLKRGPWTSEEDQKLIDYISKHGYGNWRTLPANAGLQRCGKSCRLRWTNYLRPDIKRGKFSFEEEQTIIHLHSILGNKWSAIAARLPGRTDNEIKNYWNTHIRKRLLRMGIDPVTHAPRLDLLDLSTLFQAPPASFPSSYYEPSGGLDLLRIMSQQQWADPAAAGPIQPDNLCFQSSGVQEQIPAQDYYINGEAQILPEPSTGDFGLPDCTADEYYSLLQNLGGCYEPLDGAQPLMVMDPAPLDGSQDFAGFRQVWSTPCSSQVNSSSTITTAEDEREISYCSDLLNFDVSDVFDVNTFM